MLARKTTPDKPGPAKVAKVYDTCRTQVPAKVYFLPRVEHFPTAFTEHYPVARPGRTANSHHHYGRFRGTRGEGAPKSYCSHGLGRKQSLP